VDGAHKAMTKATASEGLALVRPLLERWPDDAALDRVKQSLQQKLVGEKQDLLQKVDTAVNQGDLSKAVDLLSEAHDYQSGDP